jgi:hypothetical protein
MPEGLSVTGVGPLRLDPTPKITYKDEASLHYGLRATSFGSQKQQIELVPKKLICGEIVGERRIYVSVARRIAPPPPPPGAHACPRSSPAGVRSRRARRIWLVHAMSERCASRFMIMRARAMRAPVGGYGARSGGSVPASNVAWPTRLCNPCAKCAPTPRRATRPGRGNRGVRTSAPDCPDVGKGMQSESF